ncbi:MAG: glycosyltransferase family 2 protein [Verrucomicrobiota bacterium]
MKISACIITLNEEENLPRCLESIHDLVDEIVVVDSGSTDRTNYIATDFNARFIRNDWNGYVAQKNFALSKAKFNWVLSLDADEELSPELQSSLKTLKLNGHSELVTGYEMSRVVDYQGDLVRFGDWYPDTLVRLFKKDAAEFAGGHVHERLEINGEVQPLAGEIIHHSFKDETDYLQRMDHYSALWAEQKRVDGETAGALAPYTHSIWRFLRSYLIKGGFRGGSLGLKLSKLQAREVFLKYSKLQSGKN